MKLSKGFSSTVWEQTELKGEVRRLPNLLVVDDDPKIVTALADMFRYGYRVFTASSGDEALVILRKEDISVIVADQKMPEMTGSEFFAKARLIKPDAARILLTGVSDINVVVEAVNEGNIFFYLEKPWNATELNTVVAKAAAAAEYASLLSENGRLTDDLRQINVELEERVIDRTLKLAQRALELQSANSQLTEAKEAAVAANLAKSRLLSVVAHEFRTPLGLLIVSTGIIDRYWERLSSEKQTEQLEQIRKAALQLSQLVDSILDYSRQEARAFTHTPVMQAVAPLCRTIAEEVAKVWRVDHTFNTIIAPECGSWMLAEYLFRRVLANLLTNAFRYTPTGGTVSLTINRQADLLLIEVADTGIGIQDEDQRMIFEDFFRCDNVESRCGLGLGLSIVREALHQIHGSITLTSRCGVGTTFRVEIPMGDELLAEEQP